jgi:chromatin assembly factor 1 subunit A
MITTDTPFPVDPFSFVSRPMTAEKANNPDSENAFVMPALPDRLQKLPAVATSTDESVTKRKALNPALFPKTSFPDTHVPLLLQKIVASNTNSFVVLLDSLFQDLKALGIKKNALEVKLREVSEKDKSKKAWVVKDQAWVIL